MSTEELRDELARIGDRAPVVDVSDDIFARAQRARRRDRTAVVAAVVVMVVLVGGLAAWLPEREKVDPADGDLGRPGVPSTIWSVPSADMGGPEVEPDLAPGRAAVALLNDDDQPVVLGADDGRPHLLDLPGYGRIQEGQGAVSLSPNGRLLAWGWSGAPGAGVLPTPSGVRILDLVTGDYRTIPLTGGEGVFVYTFTWSRDSRWLVWQGTAASRWRQQGFAAGAGLTGRIPPDSDISERIPVGDDDLNAIDIAPDGEVFVATVTEEMRWDGRVLTGQQRESRWYPSAALAHTGVLLETLERGTGDPDSYQIDHRWRSPAGMAEAPALARHQLFPKGWIDDRTMVALDFDLDTQSTRLALIDLSREPEVRDVAQVDGNGQVTVAVDLITADRPTVDRPEPSWLHDDSDSDLRAIAMGLGVAGLVILLAGIWWWRRRQANAK